MRARKELSGRIAAEFCGLVAGGSRSSRWGWSRSRAAPGVAEPAWPAAARAAGACGDACRSPRPAAFGAVPRATRDQRPSGGFRRRKPLGRIPAGRRSIHKSAEKTGDRGMFWLPSPNAAPGNGAHAAPRGGIQAWSRGGAGVLETFWNWAMHRQVGAIAWPPAPSAVTAASSSICRR